MNYYDILEVNPWASKDVIKESYEKLSEIYHPDNNSEENIEYCIEKIKKIERAYNILTDDYERYKYDCFLSSISKQNINTNIIGSQIHTNREDISRNTNNSKNVKNSFNRILQLFLVIFIFISVSSILSGRVLVDNPMSFITDRVFSKTQPLPLTGINKMHSEDDCIAPFKIITDFNGMNYYLKLNNYYDKSEVMTIFIREGDILDTKIPLGIYTAKYAMGNNWYGSKDLFGAGTRYFEIEKALEFKQINDMISGFVIELTNNYNGNLKTTEVFKNNWQ